MEDWNEIRDEYITDETASYRGLAKKYGVGLKALSGRAKAEGWVALRKQFRDKAATKTIENLSDRMSDNLSDNLARVMKITNDLLTKLEQAVSELDIQLVRKVTKTKEIEYNHDARPDKPTKETVTETEEISDVRTIVDRAGLKAISSALRDIKEIQMIRSELDREEQQARIDNLRRQADRDADTATEVEVVFLAGEDSWNE